MSQSTEDPGSSRPRGKVEIETKNGKFVLSYEDFLFLERMLLNMGYRKITRYDSRKNFIRLNLSAPRPIVGREASYYYSHNGYTVILHTTFLEKEKKWREGSTDVGWNLILAGDKPVYFAKPFSRTKGFILKFLRYAAISKWKIDHRPLCPECKAYMAIFRKAETRQCCWACFNKTRHAGGVPKFESWDYELSPEDIKFVSIRREYTKRYHDKNKKEGKTPTPAAKIRKPWEIGFPENRI